MQKYSFFLYGTLTGLVSIIYVYALYANNPNWLLAGWESFTWLIIFIGLLLSGTSLRKKQPHQFIDMQPLLSLNVRVFGLAYGLKYVFVYLLFTQIDPSLLDLVKNLQVRLAIEQRDTNVPEAIFQESLQAIKAAPVYIFDGLGLALHLLFGLFLSLALAFVLKQEKPNY
jgi:Protein of unknown function (DUF4199)